MKYIWVGLCIFVISCVGGIYWGVNSGSSLEDELKKAEDALSVKQDQSPASVELKQLKLIATSANDGKAVIKEVDGSMTIIGLNDHLANGEALVEKISAQSILIRSLGNGDLTVVYLEGLDKPDLSISSLAQVQSIPLQSSN